MTTQETTTTNGPAPQTVTPSQAQAATAATAQQPPAAQPKPTTQPSDALVVRPEDERAISPFSSQANLATAQRAARALAESSLVPDAYKGNIPNTLIAMELAYRTGASVLMVMQNLDVIYNRPSWRAVFMIATVNGCNRFTPLRYKWYGTEGADDWGCRAYAKSREDGELCEGPKVTIAMAKAEGWYDRKGTKWRTMPELMLTYRAGTFWARVYAPELSLGIQTDHEIIDTTAESVTELPDGLLPSNPNSLEAQLLKKPLVQDTPQVIQEPKPASVPPPAAPVQTQQPAAETPKERPSGQGQPELKLSGDGLPPSPQPRRRGPPSDTNGDG